MTQANNTQSGIRDNRHRGSVGDFLRDKIQDGSKERGLNNLRNYKSKMG